MSNSEPWLARVIRGWGEKAIAGSAHTNELIEAYLQAHPERRMVQLNIPNFNYSESTVDDLRKAGVELCREADRLEVMPSKGPVFVLREVGKFCAAEFLFADQVEKDVRFWILSRSGTYKDKGVMLFQEWWADDPASGKKRVVKRELVGDPFKESEDA